MPGHLPRSTAPWANSQMQRLITALDQHAIFSVADAGGCITAANDLFCEISGYSREELIGRNHNLLKSNRHPPAFYESMWATITSGQTWHGEVCNRRKDGSEYWVRSTIVPFLDAHGLPEQYISIRTDITSVKAHETALVISEDRQRRAQEFGNIGTWDWNIQTGELYWSERIAPLFGHAPGSLATSYENFVNAIHPDDREAVAAAVDASLQGDRPYEIEHRVVWPDGTIRWLLERGAVTRDSEGRALRMLGVVQDITERVAAEEHLALFRQVFDASSQCVSIADAQGFLLYQNRATVALLGYADEEARGKPFTELLPQESAEQLASRIFQMVQNGEALVGQLPLRRKNGEVFTSFSNIGFVKDARGETRYLFNIFTDFTDELARRNELAQAREEAERANQAKSDFLSSMSHELRTPMNAILGFAQLLGYDAALDADQHDNVREIIKAGRHLLDLINEVLDLARIESGHINLSLEPVPLPDLVAECAQLIHPLAAARAIRLQAAPEDGSTVRADRTRLKQVLLNLLSNAVKYNREGGSIMVGTAPGESGRLRLQVSDTGPGIAPERLGDLFQPFNRLGAEHTEVEGTGIGLTITRRLTEMMGGRIGADSTPGSGTTFWVELPLETSDAPLPSGDVAIDSTVTHTPALSRCILCIDDNPVNLKLITQMLGQRRNIRLLSAHAPELGIDLARAHRPDLILVDINMPGLDGYQVLRSLREAPGLDATPVIAVTANAMPRDIERGLAAGFTDYLTKPLELQRFLDAIDAGLNRAAPNGSPVIGE